MIRCLPYLGLEILCAEPDIRETGAKPQLIAASTGSPISVVAAPARFLSVAWV